LLAAVILLVGIPISAQATVWYVDAAVPGPGSGTPEDPFVTIQAGIDAAVGGDQVLVAAGTYQAIDFDGKAVTVQSESGPEATVIQGGFNLAAVTIDSGEGNDSVLKGFTITQASLSHGIYVSTASPVIEENIIEGNGGVLGGGIGAGSSSLIIRNNTIRDNGAAGIYSAAHGGGIYLAGEGTPEVYNNLIQDNRAYAGMGMPRNYWGGGLYAQEGSPRIMGNVFVGNEAEGGLGGGLFLTDTTSAVVANNTFYNNEAPSSEYTGGAGAFLSHGNQLLLFVNNIVQGSRGMGVGCVPGVGASLKTNALWDNLDGDYTDDCPAGTGDLFVDPVLADPAGGDYHLTETSPLIDQGSLVAAGLPEEDFYGEPRRTDGDGDGTPAYDIGADEAPGSEGWGVVAASTAAPLHGHLKTESRVSNHLGAFLIPVALALFLRSWIRAQGKAD